MLLQRSVIFVEKHLHLNQSVTQPQFVLKSREKGTLCPLVCTAVSADWVGCSDLRGENQTVKTRAIRNANLVLQSDLLIS